MDSHSTLKLQNLNKDLQRLEEKERRISAELDDVRAQISLIKKQLESFSSDHDKAQDILKMVYDQRRTTPDNKGKR